VGAAPIDRGEGWRSLAPPGSRFSRSRHGAVSLEAIKKAAIRFDRRRIVQNCSGELTPPSSYFTTWCTAVEKLDFRLVLAG